MLLVVLSKHIAIHVCMLCRDEQIMDSEATITSGLLKNLSILVLRGSFIPPIVVETLLCARHYYKYMR